MLFALLQGEGRHLHSPAGVQHAWPAAAAAAGKRKRQYSSTAARVTVCLCDRPETTAWVLAFSHLCCMLL